MDLILYNTRTRKAEPFTPLSPTQVTMYNCGPTVYNYAHIGNMRAYVFADILRRTLEWNGYAVKQVINITDVGHLVSDADEGEDKMEVAREREGKSVEEIITLYSNAFYKDLSALNIIPASLYPRATAYITEQKGLIETLHAKGHTYVTSDGIYFDTSTFPKYAELAKLDVAGMQAGSRVDMGEKKHPTDFALWKFSPEGGVRREQEWDSPLGVSRKGFPGWHIECSAIIIKELGEQIDIHTGGIDHIPVHHTNEIAQSECATEKIPFVNFWLHSAFMVVDGQKMSKSLGNTYRVDDIRQQTGNALAYRYWLLTANYRTEINYTTEAITGAERAYHKLYNHVVSLGRTKGTQNSIYIEKFTAAINDDLNTAQAIALTWELLKDHSVSDADKLATIFTFDKVLGLSLQFIWESAKVEEEDWNDDIKKLLSERENARINKDWFASDRLRDELAKLGVEVKDTTEGQKAERIV